MLPSHRRAPRRLLAGSALAVTLAATSLLAGAPVHAQQSQERSAEPKQEQTRIIIMDRRDGAAPATGERTERTERTERREIRIRRNEDGTVTTQGLDPELQRQIDGCREGGNQLANINEGNDSQRTRVVVCTRGDGNATTNVEALQRARERMANNDDLSAETKQRVLAELDRAIARARGN